MTDKQAAPFDANSFDLCCVGKSGGEYTFVLSNDERLAVMQALTAPKNETMNYPNVRLIASETGLVMYEATDGAKITAITEHAGHLYVALHYNTGKNELMKFCLTAPAVDVEGLKAEQRRYFNAYDPDLSNALYNHGDALIDHLAARGYFGNVKEK